MRTEHDQHRCISDRRYTCYRKSAALLGIEDDTTIPFANAVRRSGLRWMHVRRDEVGAFTAGGEACVTRNLAFCAGTCGPGSLHFLNVSLR